MYVPKRSNWTSSDIERMITSNTKIVDENSRLKKDIILIITYFKDKKSLDSNAIVIVENLIKKYYKK